MRGVGEGWGGRACSGCCSRLSRGCRGRTLRCGRGCQVFELVHIFVKLIPESCEKSGESKCLGIVLPFDTMLGPVKNGFERLLTIEECGRRRRRRGWVVRRSAIL